MFSLAVMHSKAPIAVITQFQCKYENGKGPRQCLSLLPHGPPGVRGSPSEEDQSVVIQLWHRTSRARTPSVAFPPLSLLVLCCLRKKNLRNFLNSTKKTTKKCLPSERRGGCTTWCIFGHAILRPFFCVGVLLTNWNLQSNNGNCSNMLVGQIFECIWNDAKLSDFLSGIFLLGLFVGVLLINMSTKWKTCSSGKILGVAEMMLNYPFGHVFLRLFVGPLIYQISCWWMKHRNMISDANEQSFERWNWR